MSGLKVLVADDSPVYRKLIERALSPDTCTAIFAATGQEAIEIFTKERPALVITDWVMPDITGIELCQRIRADSNTRYTYLIMLSSHAEKENVVQGFSAGADDYLTKPFHPDELLARVRVGQRLIDLHREIEAKNRLLQELALTDSLTGLPNRRAIEGWAVRQLSGAARHGFQFWVILMDLDHFKNVNDQHGHEAGDAVLKRFAEILKANTRVSNISARIGGEEFLQVLTHVDEKSAHLVADRIRTQLEAEKFRWNGAPIAVTASFGIAGFSGKHAPEFAHLVSRADAALYKSKNLGRNRIEIDSPSLKELART
jgi:two-component system, cell cycle response regulator